MNVDYIEPLVKRIGAIRGISIFEKGGGGISGKGDLPHSRWMKIISGRRFGMLS